MRRKKIWLGIIIVAVLSFWIGRKYFSHDANIDTDATLVKAQQVKPSSLTNEVHTIGTLAARSVNITPEISGHVEKIFFRDGAEVKAGEALIQLDAAIYQAKNLSANAQLAYSENNYHRFVLLGKQGAIAKQAIDQAEADLKQKKADAEESKVMLSKMTLTAPFDGIVGEAKVNPGDYVTTGQALVTITDAKHLHIEYNVPEKFLPDLKLDETVNITSATYPGKIFTGKVAYIAPTINADNRSISLYAEVSNEKRELAAGMFVNVIQLLNTDAKAIMIPARSLVPILDGEQVYKIVKGKAVAVPVVIGKRTQQDVQILQGIAVGDEIITDGQFKLKPGMPVKIKS